MRNITYGLVILGAVMASMPTALAGKKITDTPVGPVAQCQASLLDQQLASEVLEGINNYRQRFGLRRLTLNQELTKAAMMQSIEQSAAQMLSHYARDGSDFVDRVNRTRYRGWPRAENIAWNYDTPASVVRGWIDSPGHEAILTLPDARDAGIGFVCEPDRGAFWTLVLGS